MPVVEFHMSDAEHPPQNPLPLDSSHQERPAPSVAAQAEATVDSFSPALSGAAGSTESKSIGPYRLIRKLGEGGMGLVWLAEQTAPVRRFVALKLIRSGFYDDSLLQRFKAEQQSLAVMNHPAIAKVFDAGTTPDGQPFFVMEYVDGSSITAYCDAKKLMIRDRLELFIQVCEGVQHAHQKALIHRDLKPSNVLVAELDGKPVPRIIDFGIAKAIASQAVSDQTLFTQAGAFVGTRGFVSPEQASGSEDVDTRTDVYSLGVILYVLLTGALPFDTESWKKRPMDEVLRQLREDDPPTPSSKLHSEKDTATIADHRSTAPAELARLLRGDLDWITMRALDRDRSRRYGTPTELAADIQRYLHNEPILARPASTSYRLGKYVRRHRIGVAVTVAAALLLVAFAVTQAIQLRRITRERDRANRITDFMTTMFKVSDPSEARGNTITAREVLDRASLKIDTGLAQDPEMQAQLIDVMGNVYSSLGLYSRAEPLSRRAVDIQRRALGLKNPETLNSMHHLALLLYDQGQWGESEKLIRETLDVRRQVSGREDPETLTLMALLAATLQGQGRSAEAEQLEREALEIQHRVLGPEDSKTLATAYLLAATLQREGRYAEAEKLGRETLDMQRRVLGPDHPDTLATMGILAGTLQQEGRYAEAEQLEREALGIQRRVLGPEHPDTLDTVHNLASTLEREDRYPEAEQLERETLEIQRRVLGPEHPETLGMMSNLAGTLLLEGRYAEAEKLGREALEIQRRVLGPDHPHTATSLYNLGCVAARQGHTNQALLLLSHAVDHGLPPTIDLVIDSDPDLQSLHGNPSFTVLVAHAKERAAAALKP
jgi:eukaryotic-like serine/threonine-protein kinase